MGVYVLKVKSTEKNIKVLLTKAKVQLEGDFGSHYTTPYVSATSSNKANTTNL